MSRFFLFMAVSSMSLLGLACGSTETTTNSNGVNSNGVVSADSSNIPPEFSTSPITPGGEPTPGIPPANATQLPKGATPTPGIPDPKTLGKPMKPGLTPTPGIPDPETLKRQMNQPASNTGTGAPPMMSKGATNSDANGPKTTKKP
ncbi:MAG: hypothetical protein WBD22_05295 [Pyrinomonadaceae bacterium]